MASNDSPDLEYDITFPSPIATYGSDDSDLSSNGRNELEKEPVVILLGWAGCEAKHLAKYGEIYEQKGCITIRYIAPLKDMLYKANPLKTTAVKILELLGDLDIDENPIMFHVFSNGGGRLYWHISEILSTTGSPEYRNINVIGCVYDSCPSQRNPRSSAKAVMATLKFNKFIVYLCGMLWYLALLLYYRFFLPIQMLIFGKVSGGYYGYMSQEPSVWPKLYLYSKADNIVNYREIEKVIDYQKKHSSHVSCQCWDDSPHVQHFRCHRESYMNTCQQFLDECLAKL